MQVQHLGQIGVQQLAAYLFLFVDVGYTTCAVHYRLNYWQTPFF